MTEPLRNLSGNARRRIALLSQAPPLPTLSFVVQSREKAEVGRKILSENLFRPKLGEDVLSVDLSHYATNVVAEPEIVESMTCVVVESIVTVN